MIIQKSGLTISRREVLKAGAGLAAVATLGAPNIVRAQSKTITVANSGGAIETAFKAAYFDTFEQKTGIKVISAPYLDSAKLKAMVDAKSVDIDVSDLDAAEAAPASEMGLLEEIDYNVVPSKGLQTGSANPYWTNIYIAASVIAWNIDAAKGMRIPKNWKEFFNSDIKGQRTLWKSANQTLELAALGSGVDPKKLYPIDLDAAFKTLDGIRSEISWFESGAQAAQLVSDNQVDFGMVWNGRIQPLKAKGAPVDYTFDNALFTYGDLCVPKGVKDKALSMEFIAHCVDAKNQAIFAENIPYGPTNQEAFAQLSAARLAEIPNSPENFSKGTMIDVDYWVKNGKEVFDRFNNWVVG
ncbi:extracellular solute-binding protein [Rhizobium esperanzae]|uniref:Putative spermidine/putrescine transport system substrate-binding protein n=1 Tax=Rhizobium esperanzae TaxID=1967781 RepID=A0A7W6R383_9HYPH|nr:extracellular solute-binding protein [Rhizobium esperanzae]MBB4235881.1 putative spermidine/putrescine transport system substrate-binding protein [Rhizobium esperanzae]